MSMAKAGARATVTGAAKRQLRRMLRKVGLRLQRYSPVSVPEAQLEALLAVHGIDLVLDVGANAGQYGQSLRESGYRGRIVSFEPLSGAWAECAARASRDPLWSMAPRMALGANNGTAEVHVSRNSVSSSILAMRDAHRDAAPDSAYVGVESTQVRRLDGIALEYLRGSARPFLKIDTQGYEAEVLEGAAGILNRLSGIQVEMSLTPLYEGGPTFADVLRLLQERGFALFAILPGFIDPHSARMLQADGLFFREPAPERRGRV